MTNERKRAGAGFWCVIAGFTVLAYPLSFGPACWIKVRTRSGGLFVHRVYQPLISLGEYASGKKEQPAAARVLNWYMNLGAPKNARLAIASGSYFPIIFESDETPSPIEVHRPMRPLLD